MESDPTVGWSSVCVVSRLTRLQPTYWPKRYMGSNVTEMTFHGIRGSDIKDAQRLQLVIVITTSNYGLYVV